MEAVNEVTKLLAQAIDHLKQPAMPEIEWRSGLVENSLPVVVEILEQALERLTSSST